MTRVLSLSCLILCLGAALGCGSDGPGDKEELPSLVRLWELPSSRLVPPPEHVPSQKLILEEDFSGGLENWQRVLNASAPLEDDASALLAGLRSPGPGAELELSGRRGGMYRIVPVQPNSFYEFSGAVRTEAIVPVDNVLFHGASFFVGELARNGSPQELFADGSESVILEYHNLPSAKGTSEWTERKLTLRTGADTQALLLTCVLGLSEEVASGTVLFDNLRLTQLDGHSYLQQLAAEEALKRHSIPSGDWLGERLVRESFGAETRPALVALPGETLAFLLDVPVGSPHLTCGLGSWRAAWPMAFEQEPTFVVRFDGKERLRRTLAGATNPVDLRWVDVDLDLTQWAGTSLRIEFAVQGAAGVFASPMVRDLTRPRTGPNLILISIDTLRADHVGAYGAEGNHTPNLDALAAKGILVRDVTAQAPFTLPSQVSMFSGQIPSVHGINGPGRAISPIRTPMLADLLAKAGFVTRAFTAGGFVNPIFGFDRGFDAYSNLDPLRHPDSIHVAAMIEREPQLFSPKMFQDNGSARLNAWVDAHKDERFFLFVHTYTVHDFDPAPGYIDAEDRIDPMPYMHHEFVQENGITPEILADIEAFYDAALQSVDHELGQLFAHLEATGLAQDTVIVVTSDHGKELGERGLIIHGTTLYEELTRIPLILHVPGQAARVIEEPAMLVDVTPTVLSLLGLEPDPRMQGIDLLRPEGIPDRLIWSEVDQLARKYALRDGKGLKLIHNPLGAELMFPNTKAWELFALGEDPMELDDLSGGRQADRERMAVALERYLEVLRLLGEELGGVAAGELDAETRGMLEQLGYL